MRKVLADTEMSGEMPSMKSSGDEIVSRYLRLLVHGHPLRSQDYLSSLLERGMSAGEIRRQVLLPARWRVLMMRTAHHLNATDTNMALAMIRTALEKLPLWEARMTGAFEARPLDVPALSTEERFAI